MRHVLHLVTQRKALCLQAKVRKAWQKQRDYSFLHKYNGQQSIHEIQKGHIEQFSLEGNLRMGCIHVSKQV